MMTMKKKNPKMTKRSTSDSFAYSFTHLPQSEESEDETTPSKTKSAVDLLDLDGLSMGAPALGIPQASPVAQSSFPRTKQYHVLTNKSSCVSSFMVAGFNP